MKKVIALLLVLVLICSYAPFSFAEEKEFDYQSVLGGRDGYSYDKFDKYWSYYGAYAKYFSDATLIIGLQTMSDENESNPSMTLLYAKVIDKSGNSLYDVDSIDFMIGDDIYSYEEMFPSGDTANAIIGQNGMLLLEAINKSNASDVTIRLGVEGKKMTLEDLDSSEYNELKEFCRVYLKYNLWDYCDQEELNDLESYTPLKINGEYVGLDEDDEA